MDEETTCAGEMIAQIACTASICRRRSSCAVTDSTVHETVLPVTTAEE